MARAGMRQYCLKPPRAVRLPTMTNTPETSYVTTTRVSCDGAGDIRGGSAAALGHPLVYLEIDEAGQADCGYCDKRFILQDGPADTRVDRKAA